MCGIAGFLQSVVNKDEGTETLRRMGLALKHRGPDDGGYWLDERKGVGLVHRRLEIVGLGNQGRQPMRSLSGRFIVTYNGEIYNFRDLRKRLEGKGYFCRGDSDTEVLLNGIEAWGVEKTLNEVAGMFALAIYDVKAQVLTLARDRVGEKPLYFGWGSNPPIKPASTSPEPAVARYGEEGWLR